MGINNFLAFLKTNYPQLVRTEHISMYAYQRVFVDISSYIYKYLCVYGRINNRWLNAMVNLVITFKESGVHIVPVFDGKAPQEKLDELKDRKAKREKSGDRIGCLAEAIELYRSGDRSESTISTLEKELKSADRKGSRLQRLLSPKTEDKDVISETDLKSLEQCIYDMKRQIIIISQDDLALLKRVFTSLGVSWMQAEGESEGFCCWMVKQGLGAAIVSCDSDCIIHGVDDFIFNLEPDGTVTHIEIEEVLEDLELTQKQLIDYAIIMGCDYNRYLKVNKIGPVKALASIKKYGCIENIPTVEEDAKQGLNKECLLYERCRELFQPTFNTDFCIPNHEVNVDDCAKLQRDHHLDKHLITRAIAANKPVSITFQEEEPSVHL
jgi:5'-3' exonuclease